MNSEYHVPVLVERVTEYLISRPDGVYVDGTLGGGGHAEAILNNLEQNGKLICFDVDEEALSAARYRLKEFVHRTTFIHDNVANLSKALAQTGVRKIDG